MELHKTIDRFTDAHETYKKSRSRLGSHGHLRSVVIDLLYDHFLSLHWGQFALPSLRSFTHTFYLQANTVVEKYSPPARQFTQNIIRFDALNQYSTWYDFEATLSRVDRRLSERVLKKERTIDYIPALQASFSDLEQDFLDFSPCYENT